MKSCKNIFKIFFGIIALISLLCVLVSCGGTDCTHEGGTATCTEKAKCSLCGTPYGELDPTCHSSADFTYAVNASDNTKHDKKHACCGELVETVAHTWGEGVETNPPTDDEDGLMTYTCQHCPATSEEAIPSLSHTHAPTHTAAREPDCDTDGNIEYWYCEGCDKYFSDGDCTNMILRDATVIPASHSLVSTSTTATCTEPGKTVYDCENCDYDLTVETTPALGHSVSVLNVTSVTRVEGEICKYDVVYSDTCSKCGDSAERTVRETRHTYTAAIKTAATCQSEGVKVYTCANGCQDASYEENYSDPYAHAWVVDGEPVGDSQPYKCNNNGCQEHKSVVVLTDGKIDKSDILANELKVGDVALSLDSALVSNLSDGEVIIGAAVLSGDDKTAVLNKLSSAEQTALNGKNIYDFTLTQGGTAISDFDGGKAVITVPYTLGGEDPDCIVVWFIADDGEVTVKEAIYSSGFVTFEATHFSNYAFTSVSPDDACLASGHNYVEVEGGKVEATCDTIGYTTKICTRCKDTYIADVVYELGHRFTAAPTVTNPTCDKYGKYVYTCQVAGCGHVQEVPINPVHDYEFYDEKAATCCEDGYYKVKCSICQDIKTTVYEKDPFLHQCKNEYELVEGGTSCSDGVIEYRRCQVSGCDYEELSRTFAYHEEVKVYDDEGNYIEPEYVTVDLADYVDLTSLGYPSDGTLEIRARKTACVCENVYSCVEVFDSNGSYSRSFDSYYEGSEQIELTNGMPAEWGGFSIIICFRTVAEGGDSPCYEKKTLEILINYDAATDTADETVSFTLSDGYNHKNTYNTYLLAPDSELCEDGLICTWNCRDCDTEIDRWNDGLVGSNQHRYNDIYPTYDLSRYSESGHKTYIIERRCACGMSKLEVKTGDTSATRCVFTTEVTTRDDGATVTVYTCDCGISYKEIARKNIEVNDCTSRSTQIIYYGYDEELNPFAYNTVSTRVDTYNHWYKTHKEYTYTNGCYVEYIVTLKCDCGAIYPHYTQQSYSGYEHKAESTYTLDSMHNATINYHCENCDWNAVGIDDEDGARHYFYEEIYNTQTGVKTVETSVYKYFWGTPSRILYKQEFYDISTGELISWVQTASIYTLGTERGCYEVRCITSSDGELRVEEICICNNGEYVYEEPTCTQFGKEGNLCTNCGNGEIRELYPNGHMWIYNDESSFICHNCGVTSDSDKMCAVELEILENDDGFVIGYHNRNAGGDFGRIDGTVKLEVVTADATLEADVAYTDDGKSTITITVADINAALAALDLAEGAEYVIWLSVDSGMYDGSLTRIVLFQAGN